MREKATEGTWVPYRHDDVLTRALDTKEHPGRVRGIGGMAGIKDIFGRGRRNEGPSGVISADQLHLIAERFEAIVDARVEQKVADILSRMGMHMPNVAIVDDNIPSTGRRSSCQSVQLGKLQSTSKTQETDPFADLQVYMCI